MMKLIFVVLLSPIQVFALDGKENSDWTLRIQSACASSFVAHRGDNSAQDATGVCQCVASNFVTLASKGFDPKAELRWIEKYYARKHSDAEIQRDPFFLDEHLQTVGKGCILRSDFTL